MSTDALKGIGLVDVTLSDLGTPPWGSRIAPDELGSAAAALAPEGARVLEAMDPSAARACMDGRTESPLDRLRVVARFAGSTPVGLVLASHTLLGDVAVGPGVARRLVQSAAMSGVSRVRAFDALNDPESLRPIAEGAGEAGVAFVPTLLLGPWPEASDPRWVEEAIALTSLPGAVALCVSDVGCNLTPMRLGALVAEIVAVSPIPVEVSVRAPGGLASMSALAAAVAGADAVLASKQRPLVPPWAPLRLWPVGRRQRRWRLRCTVVTASSTPGASRWRRPAGLSGRWCHQSGCAVPPNWQEGRRSVCRPILPPDSPRVLRVRVLLAAFTRQLTSALPCRAIWGE